MNAAKRAASVLLVLATVYVSFSLRASATRIPPQQVLENCIQATYGTTTEAMQRVYGRVPKCL